MADDSTDPIARALVAVVESNERLTVSLEALRAEIRAGREKRVKTRRVKSARRCAQAGDFPVDDLSAAAARRAIAKLGSSRK